MVGLINVLKPEGMSSAQVVSRVKHMLHINRCGHMGTLDPLASGVLVIACGKACRMFDYMNDKEKVYVAEFTFGYETDTLDRAGSVIHTSANIPTLEDIERALPSQIGTINQLPPKFSAKHVSGKRAYDLARQNMDVTLTPNQVVIHSIDVLSYKDSVLRVKINCGSGTYIRSIARDLSYSLNTFATMTKLVRTKSGIFNIDSATKIEDISTDCIIPVDQVFPEFGKIILSEAETKDVLVGKKIKYLDTGKKFNFVYTAGNKLYGVGRIDHGLLNILTNLYEEVE